MKCSTITECVGGKMLYTKVVKPRINSEYHGLCPGQLPVVDCNGLVASPN